ncbi:MAG: hypothetical protein ACYC7E_07605 [Armatimonadota bacterium]
MGVALIDSVLFVPKSGFKWQNVTLMDGRKTRLLVPRVPEEQFLRAHRNPVYNLPTTVSSEDRALHHALATLDVTGVDRMTAERNILAFVKNWGALGGRAATRYSIMPIRDGETLDAWIREIHDLRWFLKLLELVRKKKNDELRPYIIDNRDTTGEILFRCPGKQPILLAGPTKNPKRIAACPQGDVCVPTLWYLTDEVNDRLQPREEVGYASPDTPDGYHVLRLHATPKIVFDGRQKGGPIGPITEPTCLLGVIWLQFAHDLCGKKMFNICQYCGRPIRVGPGTKTTRRRFSCKNSRCAKRASEWRKEYYTVDDAA